MGRKFWRGLCALLMMVTLLGGTVAHAAGATPTCTVMLDLTKMPAAVDRLASEGWKWEPTQDGGTLTLRNFYQQCAHDGYGMIWGKGKVNILLEGNNIMETTSDLYQPLLNGNDVAWTVREGANGGKLTLKMPSSTKSNRPYGFAGQRLTIVSGDIHAEMVLALPHAFEMSGGSVTVEKGTGGSAAIQTLLGDVNLTGGKIKLTGSVCGIAAQNASTGEAEILVDGAELEIDATVVALSAKKITYKSGSLDVSGGVRAANTPIVTTIPGTGTTTDGKKDVPYDAAANTSFVSFKAKHTHVGQENVWEHNDTEHWQTCACGEALPHRAHQFTEKQDASGHWEECVCGAKRNMEAHTYGAWVETKAPTQTSTGLETRTCSTCGYADSRELAMLPAELPRTGDSTPLEMLVFGLALCGMALLWTRRHAPVK